jgi:hypothetical protein
MELHDQPVVEGHERHLGQQLGGQGLGVPRARHPRRQAVEDGAGLVDPQVGSVGTGVAVIGGHRPVLGAAGPFGPEVVAQARVRGDAGQLEGPTPVGSGGIGQPVGAQRGHHLEAGGPEPVVGRVLGARIIGGGKDLQVETGEEGAGPELGAGQAGGDGVVALVGPFAGQGQLDAEQLVQLVLQPQPAGRAPQGVPVDTEVAPDLPGSVRTRPLAQRLQRDTDGVEDPQNVVIGADQERGRVGERAVSVEQPDVDMAVDGDQREPGDAGQQLTGHGPGGRIHREQTVGVQRGDHLPRVTDRASRQPDRGVASAREGTPPAAGGRRHRGEIT